MQKVIFGVFELIRPKHWIKNGFVLAPLIFAGLFDDWLAVSRALLGFAVFCLAASSVYTLNDLLDVESDRKHPEKRHSRPLAAGRLSIWQGWSVLAVLYLLVIGGLCLVPDIAGVVVGYVVVNVAYANWLKHQPVIDIFVVAFGFVLRVLAGSLVIDVPLSSWMLITTLCLALYLAAVKRWRELESTGAEARKVLNYYSPKLVEKYADFSAVGSLLFYSLYVITARPELILTIPLVIFGLFRFYYIADQKGKGESPTDALWSDWPLLITILCWGAVCVLQLSSWAITV